MTALFKKLLRFTIRCKFCLRFSDAMAVDQVDAWGKFKDKGWHSFVQLQDGKEVVISACKKCSPRLKVLEKPAENEDQLGIAGKAPGRCASQEQLATPALAAGASVTAQENNNGE